MKRLESLGANATEPDIDWSIEPVRALIRSIIVRAILDARCPTRDMQWGKEGCPLRAYEWIMSESDRPWSCKWNCEVIRINHSKLTAFCKRMREESLAAHARGEWLPASGGRGGISIPEIPSLGRIEEGTV